MAIVENLKVTHRIEDKVTSVDENVKLTIAGRQKSLQPGFAAILKSMCLDGMEAREEAREVNKTIRHVADGVTQIKGLSSLSSVSMLRAPES